MTNNLLNGEDNLPEYDPTKNYLTELVGETKKFKTPEDLAKGKAESDSYIRILEKRLDDLRNDYLQSREENQSRTKLQELIDKLAVQQQNSSNEPVKVVEQKPGIDLNEIDNLLDKKLLAREASRKEQDNLNAVEKKLKEQFGTNYQAVLKERVESLELTGEDITALAKKSPTAFFKTLGLDQQQQESFQAPPRSQQRSDTFSPTSNQKRTWSYYQKMRREQPREYLNPKTAVQMEKDYQALGKDFEDGDFKSV